MLFSGASMAFCADQVSESAAKSIATNSVEKFKQPATLAELLKLPPEQLEKVDIAVLNLLCAEGLRGSDRLDMKLLLDRLDSLAVHVERETKRNQHLFDEHPEKFKNSGAYFRMAMVATVLVQDLRIQYNPEREKQLENGHGMRSEDSKKFFGDSKDVFIHGLLDGKHYGTCASMPFLYVAVARRLGYPVTLATTASHFYVRYEEGNGKHLNVEATEHRAFITPSDDEYKNPWELHVSAEEINGLGHLRPLSNKEILGHSLLTRSEVLRSMKQYDKQAETWATAARYLPDTPMWKGIVHDMQQFSAHEGDQEKRNALWDEIAQLYVPRGGGYAYFQDKRVRLHFFITHSADMATVQGAVKEFENELAAYVKPFIEPDSNRLIEPLAVAEPQKRLVLRYMPASGNEVKIPADFLPPFEHRALPTEAMNRVIAKNLENEDSILAEFWKVYDEMALAKQQAKRQQASQAGTGPVLISREQVPLEYWEGIPAELEVRLKGMNDATKIVAEINAYHSEQYIRKHGRSPSDETVARHLAGQPAYANMPPHMRNALVADPAFGYKNLAPPGDFEGDKRWLAEQNEIALHEYLQRVNPTPSWIRIVPAETLPSGPAM